MNAHTPGPWTVKFSGTGNAHIYGLDHKNDRIAGVMLRPTVTNNTTERDANARLIAAAPDLLSIVKRWVALDGGAWNVERFANERARLLDETRAAIARAEGGT